jgi:hypothetical protein
MSPSSHQSSVSAACYAAAYFRFGPAADLTVGHKTVDLPITAFLVWVIVKVEQSGGDQQDWAKNAT